MELFFRRGRRKVQWDVTIGREQAPGVYTPAPEVGTVRLCEECHAKSKEHSPGHGCSRGGPGVCRMCKRPKPVIFECDSYDFRGAADFDPNWLTTTDDEEFHGC